MSLILNLWLIMFRVSINYKCTVKVQPKYAINMHRYIFLFTSFHRLEFIQIHMFSTSRIVALSEIAWNLHFFFHPYLGHRLHPSRNTDKIVSYEPPRLEKMAVVNVWEDVGCDSLIARLLRKCSSQIHFTSKYEMMPRFGVFCDRKISWE